MQNLRTRSTITLPKNPISRVLFDNISIDNISNYSVFDNSK